jgi:hypothetical protein
MTAAEPISQSREALFRQDHGIIGCHSSYEFVLYSHIT